MCGSLFGGGRSYSTPEVQKVNPTATQVTPESVANNTSQAAENAKQKRRQGFASTQVSNNALKSIAGGSSSASTNTATNGTGTQKTIG